MDIDLEEVVLFDDKKFPDKVKHNRSKSLPGKQEDASSNSQVANPAISPAASDIGSGVHRSVPRYRRSTGKVAPPPLKLKRVPSLPSSYSGFRKDTFFRDIEMGDSSNPGNQIEYESGTDYLENITSPDEVVVAATHIEELEYTRASNVNVSNFVSVKLCGKSNYHIWKAQMECLMRNHKMLGLIYVGYDWPGTKSNELIIQYENLLNGWLIGSLKEDLIRDSRIHDKGAKAIWEKLQELYELDISSPPLTDTASKIFRYKIEAQKIAKKLHDATLERHWWKAKSILKNQKDATTLALSDNGDTLLHLAVREGNNYFVNQLLNFIKDKEQVEIRNSYGHTALHIAAIVGNIDAAELLIEKRPQLLKIEDDETNTIALCLFEQAGQCIRIFVGYQHAERS